MNREILTESEVSALYHAFRAPRRRLTIYVLNKDSKQQFTTRALAREIASIEQSVPLNEATGEPYRNVYNALSQTHLPALADLNLIIYDSERQLIAPGPKFEDAVLLLCLNTTTLETIRRFRMHDP
jgi:hypothetical protein